MIKDKQLGVVSFLALLALATGIFAAKHAEAKRLSFSMRASIAHGKYLVDAIGCGDCHTPWRWDEKLHEPVPETKLLFSGSPEGTKPPVGTANPPEQVDNFFSKTYKGGWGVSFGANITPDKETGIGSWSFADFKRAMHDGKYKSQWSHKGDGRPLMPPMPWEDFANLNDRDLHDIYNYLMSVPPVRNKVPEYIPPAH